MSETATTVRGMQPMERVMVDGWKRQLRDGWNPLYVVQGMQHWIDVRDGGAR